MSIDKNPQCPFVRRFAEDLKLYGMSERTVQSYCRALRKFIEFLGLAPDQATEDHLRNYLLFITEKRKWASSTRNVALQALKLYFRITHGPQAFDIDHDLPACYCHQCARVHSVPKACGNRHCPSCQGDKARTWLARQQARLLPCAYFMLTFTVTVTLNMVYVLQVGPDPVEQPKPTVACPKCNLPLECLGFGEQAILKVKMISSRATVIDSS